MSKTIVITGAESGIGKETAIYLASLGYAIVILYLEDEEAAKAVVDECLSHQVEASAYACDVSDENRVREVFEEIISKNEDIYALINNAGITKDQLMIRMNAQDFEKVIDVNLNGAFYCTKQILPTLIKKRSGRIINISSVVGLHGNAGQVNYAASKAGLIGMTKSLAKEVATRSVCVNAVAPGFIETDMTRALRVEIQEQLKNQIPMKRFGEAREVAGLVAFLLSDQAAYITGQTLSIDGGMNI